MTRRDFLAAVGVAVAAPVDRAAAQQPPAFEIIDTHTHFYDPTRPQGVPWPAKTDPALYRPVYPAEFRALARPLGVSGTVVVEASSWLEDNQWLLDLAARDPFLLGVVGNLAPGRASFATELARFSANPLFRGVRVNGATAFASEQVRRDLKRLADSDRALDVLVSSAQLPAVAALAAAVPDLRIVVDHCANVRLSGGPPATEWLDGIRALAGHRHVSMKVSGLVEGTGPRDGSAARDAAFYRATLDAVWESFGEDRVLFAGNWPVSAPFASYPQVVAIVRDYFAGKGRMASEKYFAGNARLVYKLPSLAASVTPRERSR
ncbi:MAG: amidohydrolase family protein [Vicinamibacterales bacterium]